MARSTFDVGVRDAVHNVEEFEHRLALTHDFWELGSEMLSLDFGPFV